jgi:HSP20 family protein
MRITRFQPRSYIDLLNQDPARAARRPVNTKWRPAVDILEDKGQFLLRADVPGVDPGEIEVSMEAGVLTISGVRNGEQRDETTNAQCIERASGRFLRQFTLPDTADAEGITAKTNNGILEVAIPKQAEIQPRRITVEAA